MTRTVAGDKVPFAKTLTAEREVNPCATTRTAEAIPDDRNSSDFLQKRLG